MQVVKSKNIRNRILLATMYFCLAFPFIGTSQYSQEYAPSDSLKMSILINYSILRPPIDVIGLSVDRKKMPIFCKWELDIQDQTKIPVKFRLGSQDYVDLLEQKTKHY